MSFLGNPAFHQLNIFDSFSETNLKKKKKLNLCFPAKFGGFTLRDCSSPMVEVIPDGFWGSFELLPWVVWGTASCL